MPIPIAVNALMRHLSGYAELIAWDMTMSVRELRHRIVTTVLLAAGIAFVIELSCAVVVALTWDTRWRVLALCLMLSVFTLLAAATLWSLARRAAPPAVFDCTLKEMRKDRDALNAVFSGHSDANP